MSTTAVTFKATATKVTTKGKKKGKAPISSYTTTKVLESKKAPRLSVEELMSLAPYPEWADKGHYDRDGIWTFTRSSVPEIRDLRMRALIALAEVSEKHGNLFSTSFVSGVLNKLAWKSNYRLGTGLLQTIVASYITQGDLIRVAKPTTAGYSGGSVPNLALRK